MPNAYYRQLTGVRAVAALVVFFTHSAPHRFLTTNPILLGLDFSVGVNIFFVLSGFLICLRYAEQATPEWSFWRRYLVNRFARIYPMWFILTTVSLVWLLNHPVAGSTATKWRHYFASLTFIKGYSGSLIFTMIPQGWTLSVEETFYVLAPVLLIWWRRGVPVLVVFGIATIALLGIGSLLVELLHGRIEGFFDSYYILLCWTLAGRCIEFFAGGALALWIVRRGSLPVRTSSLYTMLGVIGGISLLLVVSYIQNKYGLTPLQLAPLRVADMVVRWGLLQVLFALPIVAVLYGLLTEKTWLSQMLGSRLAVVLGKASFIFYLIHLGPVHEAIYLGVQQWTSLSGVLLDLVLLSVVSVIGYYAVEAPLNKVIRSWAGQPASARNG